MPAPNLNSSSKQRRGFGGSMSRYAYVALLGLIGSFLLLHHQDPTLAYRFLDVGDVSDSNSTSVHVDDLLGRLSTDQLVQLHQKINPIGIPQGGVTALPSLRVGAVDESRKIYGGAGDGKHLGGFTELDLMGVSPAVWRYMLSSVGVRSVLDVGCGRGTSSAWFALHNVRTRCVEGSHDAIQRNMLAQLDSGAVTEHDFSRGPWWPKETYDAVWAVEILEHIGVNYQYNYLQSFRKAALLFVTSSRWGGWHHVEVHPDEVWIRRYENAGFRYDADLTEHIRGLARMEATWKNETAPNGETYCAQHISMSMKVFVNPAVAALPEHAHLFPRHGCYKGQDPLTKKHTNRPCGTGRGGELESTLPTNYMPLIPTLEQDEAWARLVKANIKVDETS